MGAQHVVQLGGRRFAGCSCGCYVFDKRSERRQELVQRRIDESNGGWLAFQGIEDSGEVCSLENEKLVERQLSLGVVIGQDHSLNDRSSLAFKEHVLGSAKTNSFSTKTKGSLEAQMASVHAGEVDVLVGTQMVTKGHDFRRITLVAAVNPDSALFAADFRAPERLFSLLMQAAGRAGRDASMSEAAEMWLQTHHPQHPLYKALAAHDYPAFATSQLAEREGAAMPPFSYQALVRAEGRTQELAQAFLDSAAAVVGLEPEFEPWRDPASAR